MAAHYFDAVAEHFLRARESLSFDFLGRLFTAFLDYAYNGRPFEEALGPVDSGSKQTFRIMKEEIDHRRDVSERCLASHREKKAEKENRRENEKERTKEKEKEKPKVIGERKEPFSPPSLEEIKAFLGRKNLQEYAEPFFDYYTGNGWMMGLAPMEDWHGAVMSWIRCNRRLTANSSPEPGRLGKHLPVQDYDQRDYSDMQQRAMERFIAANTEEEQS